MFLAQRADPNKTEEGCPCPIAIVSNKFVIFLQKRRKMRQAPLFAFNWRG